MGSIDNDYSHDLTPKPNLFWIKGRADQPMAHHTIGRIPQGKRVYNGTEGRFPSNVFITEETGEILDQQSGVSVSTDKRGRIENAQGVYANQGRTGWRNWTRKG